MWFRPKPKPAETIDEAMARVNRALFLPEEHRETAFLDTPVIWGNGQVVPPAQVTRLMVELLRLKPDDNVLVIGTGSGYQTAVVAEMTAGEVHSIDINRVPQQFVDLLPENVIIRERDGRVGLPECGNFFDAILVTCGTCKIWELWPDQLVEGGRLVVPIGDRVDYAVRQELRRYTKLAGTLEDEAPFAYVAFQPIT